MRTFKIFIVTVLLIGLALVSLFGISKLISSEPASPEFEELYEEGHTSEEGDPYDIEMQKLSGVVRPLGVSIYQEGTHRLEKDNKLQLLLESKVLELADFEQQEVEVEGVVRSTVEGNQKIMEVLKVNLPKLSSKGRKSFNDVGYDYYFDFPSDWSFEKEVGKVVFYQTGDEEKLPVISVLQHSQIEGTLSEWLKDHEPELATIDTAISIDGASGVRRSYLEKGTDIMKTYVMKGTSIFEVRYVGNDETIKRQYLSVIDSFTFERPPEDAIVEDITESNEKNALQGEGDTEEGTGDTEEVPNTLLLSPEEETSSPSSDDEEDITSTDTDSSGTSLNQLQPLTQKEIQSTIAKGYSNFEGRSLVFDYPNDWLFTWLGDGHYGFTDYKTASLNDEDITFEISRLFVIVGDNSTTCSYSKAIERKGTNYTVCARETGLEELVNHIATTLRVPE
jgi:hypothetical protein